MTRGFSNVGIPPALAREIRTFLEEGELGYTTLAEFVRDASRFWLVEVRRVSAAHSRITRPRGARRA